MRIVQSGPKQLFTNTLKGPQVKHGIIFSKTNFPSPRTGERMAHDSKGCYPGSTGLHIGRAIFGPMSTMSAALGGDHFTDHGHDAYKQNKPSADGL
jgi:hypothetical protein